jgi:hypothetical protein
MQELTEELAKTRLEIVAGKMQELAEELKGLG